MEEGLQPAELASPGPLRDRLVAAMVVGEKTVDVESATRAAQRPSLTSSRSPETAGPEVGHFAGR